MIKILNFVRDLSVQCLKSLEVIAKQQLVDWQSVSPGYQWSDLQLVQWRGMTSTIEQRMTLTGEPDAVK